ncbi:hypothetical protein A1Q1_05461 [Trichosporon asahii var. asahii CBS 2479]|uniref:Aldehyde dehydrogenase domain-containing protein n=1 Tax=Trichosporon asahii var. asahii (strain ATCC 90039 / CBS 2479 / JCM 2466 / KCTC 7840 / NBRC 103889/ NCYC 2677 / UAMH 7654) TaxID=1186058 RepID=J5TQX8_TRIAS|nr:hypothetical protein A1Q1_05461 [Trichosporon asahii var. asahii CBS 2479]EJT52251.1 hypothetical protein A1Q1_05461 [Trichosporon asahii var. asahii CBS 2479]
MLLPRAHRLARLPFLTARSYASSSTHSTINLQLTSSNNKWVPSSTQETFPTYNPATGKPIASVAHASSADVDAAVDAARTAFNTTWGMNVDATERAALINKLADLIERDASRLAALERYATCSMSEADHSLNSGKGVRIARLPYNYPIMMMAWKCAAALAAGCTIIVKPSELTPLTTLAICDLAKEAGFPPGVLNALPGLGGTTGSAIASHMGIDKISIAAASSNLKKVTLELGGKSPLIVFNSADVKQAADWTAMGVFYNTGQDCTASSREENFDEYVVELKQRAEACAIGQPYEEATSMGPLRDKVRSYIQSGLDEGATIVTGGLEPCGPEGDDVGYWQRPTIFTNTRPNMRIVREEIFGPVVCVIPFKTEEEALHLANDTEFGLGAGVFTTDITQATRVSGKLEVGTVWINQYGLLNNSVPFGGFKSSGIGRELGTYGLQEHLQVKGVHLNLTQTVDWPI